MSSLGGRLSDGGVVSSLRGESLSEFSSWDLIGSSIPLTSLSCRSLAYYNRYKVCIV